MPLKPCTNKDGKKGWQWGNGGCIVGKDAKKRAIRQAIKIEGPDKFSQIMKSDAEALTILREELLLPKASRERAQMYEEIEEAINAATDS